MRRFGMKTGIVASMEAEDQRRRTEGGDEPEELDNAESPESAQLEVADSAAEGEAEMTDLDEAGEVSDALESLAMSVEGMLANGGMSRETAGVVMQYNAFLCSRVGIESEAVSMPSLESFGGTSTRMRANTLALEGIKDTLKKVWDAIVAALKRMGEWVKDFWNKYFGAAEKLDSRAKAVEAACEKITGNKAKESSFEDGSLYKRLYTGDKIDAGKISKSLADLKTSYQDFISATDKVESVFKDDLNSLKNFDVKKADFTKGLDAYTGSNYGTAGANMAFYRTGEFPGGRTLVVKAPSKNLKGKEALEAIGKFTATLSSYNDKEPTKTVVPTLNPGQITEISRATGELARFMVNNRKKVEGIENKINEAIKSAERMANDSGKSAEESDDKEIWSAAASAYRNMSNILIKPVTLSQNYSLELGKASLDYCEKSIKLYETAK